jgi:formate dehydrogenase major subunit
VSHGNKLSRRGFLKIVGITVPSVVAIKPAQALGMPLEKHYEFGEVGGKGDVLYAKEIRTICTYCAVGCGVIAYVRGDKVLHLEGDPDNPLNKGRLCSKGKAGLQLFSEYNENRLKKPLMRTGPKPPADKILGSKSVEELENLLRQYPPNWKEVTWGEAFRVITDRLERIVDEHRANTGYPVRAGPAYYYDGKKFPVAWLGSAKFPNEEAYLAKKLMSIMGSYNIDHQARKCHSTTVAGLAGTFGFGAQTQSFPDLQYPSVFLVFGGNPAENHPVSFYHVSKGMRERGLKLLVADPRFNRSGAMAEIYLPFRSGSDIAFIYYIAHYALFERSPAVDGLPEFGEYMGRLNINRADLDEFKQVIKEYDAATVSKITGTPQDKLRRMAEIFVENSGVTTGFKKFSTIQWAMGVTQHSCGTQIVRSIALVQLLLGNMGYPGGGVNPFRGHCNVQGATDVCVLSHILPGYIKQPSKEIWIRAYQDWKNQGFPDAWNWEIPEWAKAFGVKPTEKDKVSSSKILWSWWFHGWRRFELTWGIFVGTDPEDDPEKGTVISDLPFGAGYTEVTIWQGMYDKVIRALFVMGENIAVSSPDERLYWATLSDLDLLVVGEIFETETAYFADVLLPAAISYEKEGSKTNSNRWFQWQDRIIYPPGEAKPDLWMMQELYDHLRDHGVIKLPSEYAEKRKEKVIIKNPVTGEFVTLYERRIEPFMNYRSPQRAEEDYREIDPVKVYKELDLAVDLYYGQYDWVANKVLAKRRDPRPRTPGMIDGELDAQCTLYKSWGWSWPKNVRILYSRDAMKHLLEESKYVTLDTSYVVGGTFKVTGETGELRDAKNGKWRPAFFPGHSFSIGKLHKRKWSGMTDVFTGYNPWTGEFIGKFVSFLPDGSFKIETADELGVRYPAAESFYYDPEVVALGKANFKKLYFKGVKKVGGKEIKYVSPKEWQPAYANLRSELKDLFATKTVKDVVPEMISKYGVWYACRANGNILGYDFRYPIHTEPAESLDKDLIASYPPLAWTKAENLRTLKDFGGELQLSPDEMKLDGAVPVVLTTFRLTEHFHTGAMTRNLSWLLELVPEMYAEIPEDLARQLGIKGGDYIRVGNNRAEIKVRAMVTKRAQKLLVNDKETFVVGMPWHWGFKGGGATFSVANLLTPPIGDVTTTMQESKVFIGYVKKG